MKVLDIYGEITLKGLDKVNNDLEALLKKAETFATKFESIFGKVKLDKLPTSKIAKELDKELKKVEVAIDKVAKKTQEAFGMSNNSKDSDWSKEISDRHKELEKLRTLKDTVNSESNQQNYAEIAKNIAEGEKEIKRLEKLRDLKDSVNSESNQQNYSAMAKDIEKRAKETEKELKSFEKLKSLKDIVNSESNQQNYAEIAKNLGISDKEAKRVESLRQQVNDESSNQNYAEIAKDIAYEDRKRERQEIAEKKALEKKMKKEEEAEKKKKGFLDKQNEEAYKAFKVMALAVGTLVMKVGKEIASSGMAMLRGSGKEGTDLWSLVKTTGEDPKKLQELQARFGEQGIGAEKFRAFVVHAMQLQQQAQYGEGYDKSFGYGNVDPITARTPVKLIQQMMANAKLGKNPANTFGALKSFFMDREIFSAAREIDPNKKLKGGYAESWGTIQANHKIDGAFTLLDQHIQRLKDSLSAKVGGGILQVLRALINLVTPKVIKDLGDVVLIFTKWATTHVSDLQGFVNALTTGLPAITKLLLWVTEVIGALVPTASPAKPGEDTGYSPVSDLGRALGRDMTDKKSNEFKKYLEKYATPMLGLEGSLGKFLFGGTSKKPSVENTYQIPEYLRRPKEESAKGKTGTIINHNNYFKNDNIIVEKELDAPTNKLFSKAMPRFGSVARSNVK